MWRDFRHELIRKPRLWREASCWPADEMHRVRTEVEQLADRQTGRSLRQLLAPSPRRATKSLFSLRCPLTCKGEVCVVVSGGMPGMHETPALSQLLDTICSPWTTASGHSAATLAQQIKTTQQTDVSQENRSGSKIRAS